MKIENVPFMVTDWKNVPEVEYKGETGSSRWRMREAGNIRARIVDYSPCFRSDHFCARGHVLLVLEGELFIELKNGARHALTSGMSFQASDDENNPHLAYTEKGARVFIVD